MCPNPDQPLPLDPSPLRLLPESGPSGASLPRWLTSFLGREREIAAVLTLIERGDLRLLTLTGPGGVGKTRLAVRVAETTTAFTEGTWFVPLASIRDPALVMPTIANGLGVPAGSSNTAITELARFIGDRHGLLLLDNLEQVLEGAIHIKELLLACPNLNVMVTSRIPLNVSGEHIYLIPPMPLPPADPTASLEQVAANDTVALFVTRSQARSTGFTLTAGNAGAVVEICRRLDGLPLAIELAASRVAALPVPVLLERLNHRLATLTGGPRDAPDRLRTMGNAIAWSHELLNPTEQTLLRRLGAFVNGFTLEAAEGITGFDLDLVDTLDGLLANSLVSLASSAAGEPRYVLLETVREFAADRLGDSDEDAAIRRRHARWYMAMTEAAIPYYDGPQVWTYTRKVEAEIDNCRAALAWCAESNEPEIGLRLAGALWRIWQAHLTQPWMEQWTEGRLWLERFLPARDGVPFPHLVQALHGISELAHALRNLDEAEGWATELLTRSEEEDEPYGIRWASTTLGRVALRRGDREQGERWLERALATSAHVRDPENHRGMALCDLADLALESGDRRSAVALLLEARSLFQACGNEYFLARTLIALGNAHRDAGDIDGALSHFGEAVGICLANGDMDHSGRALYYIAGVALDSGQLVIAARLHAASSTLLMKRWPEFRLDLRGELDRVRDAMGEDAFTQAWHEGEQMTPDEVRAEVTRLREMRGHRAETEPAPTKPHGFTPRELDVLRLLADGRSNRAIADAFSLSERTVENHVLHILTKLDVDSRTAAATWAVRHGLD